MSYKSFVEARLNMLFRDLSVLPKDLYDPLSYSFADFFVNGTYTKYSGSRGAQAVMTGSTVRPGRQTTKDEMKVILDVCIGFYDLGMRCYDMIKTESRREPDIADISGAADFILRRLGRVDYAPPAIAQLLETKELE